MPCETIWRRANWPISSLMRVIPGSTLRRSKNQFITEVPTTAACIGLLSGRPKRSALVLPRMSLLYEDR
ncbi:Uncharacterised protein [Mycobacteroides abscessus]|nr:Uncharacterised protein [Mycobacteroides abscessus]